MRLVQGLQLGQQDAGERTAVQTMSPPLWLLSEAAGQSHSPSFRPWSLAVILFSNLS